MATSIPFTREKGEAAGALKRLLQSAGIVVTAEDTMEHGVKLHASYDDASFALIIYFTAKTGRSSRVVLEKETDEIARLVAFLLTHSVPAAPIAAPNHPLEEVQGQAHIGVDESGKGDYFGPLVISGVCITPQDEPELLQIGVKDSKLIADKQVVSMAGKIRAIISESRYDTVQINPEKYNELYLRIRNLNKLLAWGHARVLENLLAKAPCSLAVCDQFGDASYINRALMERGKAIRLIQTPKAEQDLAVAAASILARDTFLRRLGEISDRYGMQLPKGASSVIEAARKFVDACGQDELGKVAKLHFKTTEKVLKAT